MASLLETVNRLITDNGIAGGEEITTFENVEPEISRAIGFVITADYEIQGAWHDWDFMYYTASVECTAGLDNILLPTISVQSLLAGALTTTTYTADYPIKDVEHGSMVAMPQTDSATPLPYVEWVEFERTWERLAKTAQAIPAAWSMKPNRTLVMSHLAPSGSPPLSLQYRCYIMPRKVPRHVDAYMYVPSGIVNPADTLSSGVSQAIVELATMKWARAERQFDILAIAAEGYKAAMEELRYLHGRKQQAHGRMSVQSPLEVAVL